MDHRPSAMKPWRRYRFHANLDDPRPILFPPPGPWWESGFSDDYAIVIAYLPPSIKLKKYWPEATKIDYSEEDKIEFTDRFPRPKWWKEQTT